jgi:hypothetical protein
MINTILFSYVHSSYRVILWYLWYVSENARREIIRSSTNSLMYNSREWLDIMQQDICYHIVFFIGECDVNTYF